MTLLALSPMSNTFRFIFVTIGLLLFIFSGIAWHSNRGRLELTALGLAAVFFPMWWDLLALVVND